VTLYEELSDDYETVADQMCIVRSAASAASARASSIRSIIASSKARSDGRIGGEAPRDC
jgi:hypothetical protein